MKRHWLTLGTRHGIVAEDGRQVQHLLDDLVERTPKVIALVQAQLPEGFPQQVAQRIFDGLRNAADRLSQ